MRGVSGSSRANKYGRVTDYFHRVEEETTVIMQIETIDALKRAEAIAAVDGVDGIFFGPADIAAEMSIILRQERTRLVQGRAKLDYASHSIQ